MKLTVYLNLILFYFPLTGAGVYDNGASYVSLIKWIRGYYSTSEVFFLYPHKKDKYFDDLKLMQISYLWSRTLGREQIAFVGSSFNNIHAFMENCYPLRSLMIVFITRPEAVFEFSDTTKSLKMSSFAWFVIFLPSIMDKNRDYCYAPSRNWFNLSFDTEMLVMCYGDPVLREWYSVDGSGIEIFDLIKWYPNKHPSGSAVAEVDVLTNLSLYERRNDLRGKVLQAVTVKNSLLVTVKGNKLMGYLSRVIDQLENALNFTVDIVAEETEYGIFNTTTKRWNGALNLVATTEVDIGISDFSMTNIRRDYVDYMVPIITSRHCLYMKRPEIFAVKWFAYYKTFSLALWISIIIIIIISQSILAFIRSRIESCTMRQVMVDELFRIWAIICQQGLSEFPRYLPLRLAYFSILVNAIVIFSAYSASLISFVTARVRDLPFSTIEEFIKDGTFSVIVLRGSSDYDIFSNSNDSLSMSIRNILKPYDTLPLDVQSAFLSICDDQRLALYTDYTPEFQKRAIGFHIPCEVSRLDIGQVSSLSFILSKNSQYTSLLNYYLQKLLSTGLLDRFKNEVSLAKEPRFQPVGFSSVASVLIIFSCGAALAFLILISEIIYFNMLTLF